MNVFYLSGPVSQRAGRKYRKVKNRVLKYSETNNSGIHSVEYSIHFPVSRYFQERFKTLLSVGKVDHF